MDTIEFKTGVIKPIECYKEGWALIKGDYWLLFAILIVGAAIGGVTLYILLGAMMCGVFKCYLNTIDGIKPEFEILFNGIKQYFASGLLVTLFFVVPIFITFSIIYVPLLLATMSGQRMNEEELFALLAGSFIVEFFVAIVMVCLHTLLMFSFPLIADKNLSGMAAMKLSARAVWHNKSGVAGIWAVGVVVGILGYLALCIGFYFTIPIVIAGNTVAYRKVFPSSKEINQNPPPPNAYAEAGIQN